MSLIDLFSNTYFYQLEYKRVQKLNGSVRVPFYIKKSEIIGFILLSLEGQQGIDRNDVFILNISKL